MAGLGAGADVVSGGELKKALAAGIPANKIVFSGVGKTRGELKLGLEAGIYQFNVESEPELEALDDVAAALGKRAPITIRVNPDVDAQTHVEDFHRPRRNQIRYSLEPHRARLSRWRHGFPLSISSAWTFISAARS